MLKLLIYPKKITKKWRKSKYSRYISAVVILVITLAVTLITDVSSFSTAVSPTNEIQTGGIIGRAFGLMFYVAFAGFMIEELFKHMKITRISLFILFVGAVVTIFAPFNVNFTEGLFTQIFTYKFSYIKNFYSWIFFVSLILIVCLVYLSEAIFSSSKITPINLYKAFVYYLIIVVFVKTTWLLNILNWQYVFIFILPIAFINDTAAFFGGRYIGKIKDISKYKMAPKISPKKSWIGFITGIVFAGIFTGFVGYHLDGGLWGSFNGLNSLAGPIIMAVVLPISAVIGDLIFSHFKRTFNIKDFSNKIPGHGGFLDRFDSTSFVVVIVTMTMLIV